MSLDSRMSVELSIDASAARIFALITDPRAHVDIDGSGMLIATPGAAPVRAVGDTFEMSMDREPLGDLPMGRYQVLNAVTAIEPDRLLEWSVGSVDRSPLGHVWGYELTPVDDASTTVTSYCDWSGLHEKLRGKLAFPIVPREMMEQSLVNLKALAEAH